MRSASLLLMTMLGWSPVLQAQLITVGAQSAALGNQAFAIEAGAANVLLNPAMLVGLDETTLWAQYYRPFGLPDLSVHGVAGAVARQNSSIGIGWVGIGHELYREQVFAVAAAVRVAPILVAGTTLKYHAVEIEHYGRTSHQGVSFGLALHATQRVLIGSVLKNVLSASGGSRGTSLPRESITGIRIRMVRGADALLELRHAQHFAPSLSVGVILPLTSFLQLRGATGLNTPEELSTGLSLHVASLHLHYAFQSHPVLPATHVFSLTLGGGR